MKLNQLVLLGLTMALAFGSKSMMEPLVPLYGLALGASPAMVGLLVSAAFLLPLFLAIPTGALVDRWGSRELITAAAAALAAAELAVMLVPGLLTLALAQVVIGLCQLTLAVAAQVFVATLDSGKSRETNFGWYTTFLSAGQLAGPLLAGVVADQVGYSAGFGLASVIAAAAALVSRFLVPGKQLQLVKESMGLWGGKGHLRAVLSKAGVQVAILLTFGILFGLSVFQTFFPVYLDELAYSATTIGVLISLRPLTAMLVRPFISSIVRIFGSHTRTAGATVLLVALGLATTSLVNSTATLVLASVLVGIGWGISQPFSMVMIVDHVRDAERGFALGIRLTGNRLAQFSSPLLFGLFAEFVSVRLTFVAAGILVVTLAVLFFRMELKPLPKVEAGRR
ncbi:MAG: MFS transporter [Trueperaceae bacterium]